MEGWGFSWGWCSGKIGFGLKLVVGRVEVGICESWGWN